MREPSFDNVKEVISRAAVDRFLGPSGDASNPEALRKLRMQDVLQPRIDAAIRRALLHYDEARTAAEIAAHGRIDWTAHNQQLLESAIGEVLDDRPVGKAASSVFRPMWPMTLAQLRGQVAALEPRRNPAPRAKNYDKHRGSLVYEVLGKMPKLIATHSLPAADYDYINKRIWARSMPESFPPFPRRGGVYSADEAGAINAWLRDHWPVVHEVRQILRSKDKSFVLEGGDPQAAIWYVTGSTGMGKRNVATTLFDEHRRNNPYPSFTGMTPKELHSAVLENWTRSLQYLDGVLALTLELFQRGEDPDAHMRALADNLVTRGSIRTVADRVYGVSRFHEPWIKDFDQWARSPAQLVAAYPDNKTSFPLSWVIERDEGARKLRAAEVKKREQLADAEAQTILPVLRALYHSGKGWTRQGIEKAVPGVSVTHRQVSANHHVVEIVGPVKHWRIHAYGVNIGDALGKIAQTLKLDRA